jgi:hypothetical protein
VGETTTKTLVPAVLAWLLARVLRRVIGAALLAGGLAFVDRRGVDVGDVGRVLRCETHAITRAAKQLRDIASSSAPSSTQRQRRALRRLAACRPETAPAKHARERQRP